MELIIDNDYRVITDERCFILQKRYIVGENDTLKRAKKENIGKESWKDMGYYRTLRQTLKDYLRKRVLKSDVKSFKELVELVKSVEDNIDKVLKYNHIR
jgi:hypothetical protein